jgi:UPF0755 protein
LNRILRIGLFLALAFGFLGAICFGVLLIVSAGQPIDFIQTELIRFSLFLKQDELNNPVGTDASPVRFKINPGDSPRQIASNLLVANLITNATVFVDYARISELDTQFEAGTYFLNQTMTIPEIAVLLTDSASSQFPFRILEGWRIEEVAEAIDQSQPYFAFSGEHFLEVVGPGAEVDPAFAETVGLPEGASLEGFLFPDSYQLPAEVTPTMLRDILLQNFLAKVGTQLREDAEEQGFTLYEVVTLASIVQREQGIHPDEHPLIASVYRNRLDAGMKLDADPTVQYPIGRKGRWWPSISISDYTGVVSDYNTYLNYGLPPGPIANPGLTAIRAAVYPAESSYFYFRADCSPDGYHTFATTYDEHLANGC